MWTIRLTIICNINTRYVASSKRIKIDLTKTYIVEILAYILALSALSDVIQISGIQIILI